MLGDVGMALHHKLCHTLGGSLNLPHAETHTVVLPHALAYNAPAAPAAMASASAGDGCADAARACSIREMLGAPLALKDMGMPENATRSCRRYATQSPY